MMWFRHTKEFEILLKFLSTLNQFLGLTFVVKETFTGSWGCNFMVTDK
jgi:hypothetical protein